LLNGKWGKELMKIIMVALPESDEDFSGIIQRKYICTVG
jgi:hypothetical protein